MQLCVLVRTAFNRKARLVVFTSVLFFLFLTYTRALNRKRSELYQTWTVYAHEELGKRKSKSALDQCTNLLRLNNDFAHDDCLESFCNVLIDARTLSVHNTDRLYRAVSFEIVKLTLPGQMQFLEFRTSSLYACKLRKYMKSALFVPSVLYSMIFSSKSDRFISDMELDTMERYPEVIHVLREDSRKELRMLYFKEVLRRISSLVRYIILSSWEKIFSYFMLIGLSIAAQQLKNRIIYTSTISTFQAEILNMVQTFLGESMTSARLVIVQKGVILCSQFLQVSLIESAVNNLLLRFTLFVASNHRKRTEEKFYNALERAPTDFFDLHSIYEVEEMYYFMHDLEGVETQILMHIKNIIQALSKIIEIQDTLNASSKDILAAIFCNQLITWVSESITPIWCVLPLNHLTCVSRQATSASHDFLRNPHHAEEKILFNDPMYRSILSNVKTYRSMGIETILFDGLRQAYYSNVTSFVDSDSFLESITKIGWLLRRYYEKLSFSNLLHVFEESILLKFSTLLIKALSICETCANSFTFLYFLAQERQGYYGVSINNLFALFDTFGASLRACRGGIMFEVIHLHAQKASKLNSFFTRPSQDTTVKPIPISIERSIKVIQNKGSIRLQNVSFKYPNMGSEALQNISLQIPLGLFTVIRGRNGTGKSTLLSLLARLYMPSEGQIDIRLPQFYPGGKREVNILAEKWRSVIAFLPQEHALLPCSVLSNIHCLRPEVSSWAIGALIEQIELARDVRNLPQGIHTSIGNDENQAMLSKGQTQKVMLARVLAGNPRIVLLDEPTNFLDGEAKQSLIKTIKSYLVEPVRKSKFCSTDDEPIYLLEYVPRTVVCVSHDESMILHADNVIDFPPSVNSYHS